MKKNKDKNKVDLAISKQLMFYKKKKILLLPYHDLYTTILRYVIHQRKSQEKSF